MKCAWNCQDHEIHLEFYCLCSGMSVSKIIPPRPSAFPEAPSRFLHPGNAKRETDKRTAQLKQIKNTISLLFLQPQAIMHILESCNSLGRKGL